MPVVYIVLYGNVNAGLHGAVVSSYDSLSAVEFELEPIKSSIGSLQVSMLNYVHI